MTLTLTVLGCDGSHAGPGGQGSGYLVRDFSRGVSLWLDAGPGTFANLQRFTDPAALTGIVLTHEHDDHWSDIAGFVTAARWTMGFRRDPVPVFAAPGIRPRIVQDSSGILDWREVSDDEVTEVAGLRLRFSRTEHPVATFAVRVEGSGERLGYSADSGPGWSMRSLGTDLDLALCEATYTKDHEKTEGIHMSGRQAGRTARDAGAKRLVVTHRWHTVSQQAVVSEASESFQGPVRSAEPGMGFTL
ncbi:MAG: MBL fold metallo-hydrolase [Acidimicrobiales bacterium]